MLKNVTYNISDFDTTTPLFSVTLDATATYNWGERQLDLSDYVGDTIHIAFRHHGCYDQWALLLDDISVEFGQIVSVPPATVPYATGFEPGDDSLWSFVNTSANGWYRGTAATANGNSLYISADSGANVSNLLPGAYFVRVATHKGVLVKKFIVK